MAPVGQNTKSLGLDTIAATVVLSLQQDQCPDIKLVGVMSHPQQLGIDNHNQQPQPTTNNRQPTTNNQQPTKKESEQKFGLLKLPNSELTLLQQPQI